MNKIRRDDLMSLEKYAAQRVDYRRRVMAHKKNRQVAIGPNATLYFEDRVTMQYQIQEVLRVEKIFEASAIEEELQAYNPLVPDGNNWKATFMIEYDDEKIRRHQLSKLIGIEQQIWVRVGEMEKVKPIADEDLERQTAEKTSAVHFLRFELTAAMIVAAKNGAEISVGVAHPNYHFTISKLNQNIADSLVADLVLEH